MKFFMDTGAFIALVDAADQNHKKAADFFEETRTKGARLVTSNFVVCETMNYLRSRVSYSVAIRFWEKIHQSSRIEINPITPVMEKEAFKIFKQYADKDFSFTDCTSFSLMKNLGNNRSFAFDKHFEQYPSFIRSP